MVPELNAVWLQLRVRLPDGQVTRCTEFADGLSGRTVEWISPCIQQFRHGPQQQGGECEECGGTQGGVDVFSGTQAAGDGGGGAEFLHGLGAGLFGTQAGQGELPAAFGDVVEQFGLGLLALLATQAAGGVADVLLFGAHANSR
ncbi:hypothetical protein BXU09_02770 [Deinococcus sp. LM3]|nr:hypothetical protein BXU09_02770 [Deinococcus sp. LM3]